MDLVASCKDKLEKFRGKELKDVLTQLGLSKQGRKQDLVDRIIAVLSGEQASGTRVKKIALTKEQLAKLVDDTYMEMQVSLETDSASKVKGVSDVRDVKLMELADDLHRMDKIHCLCESSLQMKTMIKCEDPRCHVWQHIGCVIIPEVEGVEPVRPELFYCELCRLSRADPFWVTISHPLYPVKLPVTKVPDDGDPVLTVETTFSLTREDKDLLSKQEYDVQAWCMLLNDKVQFRMQWPLFAELHVNGVPIRVRKRRDSQLLGVNGRDDGPLITQYARDGRYRILLTGCDARQFCFGVRIVKHHTVQQILDSIPKESDGEQFEDALARIRRCVGGGPSTEHADSDSDLEVVADCISVNLRCPMSGFRIKVAGRFKPCVHMGCFDLEVFVQLNQHSRKWQCPICMENYSLENIIIDPYFNRITSMMRNCEDVTEIEVKPDGSWRAKAGGLCSNLGIFEQWHLPDGSLRPPINGKGEPRSEVSHHNHIKQKGTSDGHSGLNLGIKNYKGFWEANEPEDKDKNHVEDIICMSSSDTTSGGDGKDLSVNQDAGQKLKLSSKTEFEVDSVSAHINPMLESSIQLPESEVIVLSDSDEVDEIFISPDTSYEKILADNAGAAFSNLSHGELDKNLGDFALGTAGDPSLVLNASHDDGLLCIRSLTPVGQEGVCSYLDGLDALVDIHHSSTNCSQSAHDLGLTAESAIGSAAPVPESCTNHTDVGLANKLVPSEWYDPLYDTTPSASDVPMQTNLRDQLRTRKGINTEDHLEIDPGDDGSCIQGGPVSVDKLDLGLQAPSGGSVLDSVGVCVNNNISIKRSREMQDNCQRTVRPRLFLVIDSDSE